MMKDSSVRIVALPADPSAVIIDFDEIFWPWWKERQITQVGSGGSIRWGQEERATAHAALYYVSAARRDDEPLQLSRYLALHRSGGIDLGLGHSGAWTRQDQRVFQLTSIVAHLWATLRLLAEVATRWPTVSAPFELTVALRDTRGAVLGGVAEGWRDANHGAFGWEPPVCWDQNVILRLEVPEVLDDPRARELAERLGGWVEDAFGSRDRRFLPRTGDSAGHLDLSKFRSE